MTKHLQHTCQIQAICPLLDEKQKNLHVGSTAAMLDSVQRGYRLLEARNCLVKGIAALALAAGVSEGQGVCLQGM